MMINRFMIKRCNSLIDFEFEKKIYTTKEETSQLLHFDYMIFLDRDDHMIVEAF